MKKELTTKTKVIRLFLVALIPIIVIIIVFLNGYHPGILFFCLVALAMISMAIIGEAKK